MDYDPVKDRLGAFFDRSPWRTRVFFRLLDLVFLRAWYVHRRLRDLLGRLSHNPVHVLDAGTGFGQYAWFLLRTDARVRLTAVDIKEDYLARAERFFRQTPHTDRIAFRFQDLTQPLPERDHFDLVLSVDVMEHIDHDRGVFRHFFAALRPGGYVLINTPSDLGGSGVTEAGQQSFIGEHVRDGYNADDLKAKLAEAGLQPILHEYAYGPFGTVAWRLLVQGPIQALNASWLFAPLVAVYYLVAAPLGFLLNALDLARPNARGTGLVVVAQKPA